MALRALPMPTTFCTVAPAPPEARQRRKVRLRHQHHASTAAAITTIGPTPWHILLTPEARNAVAPIASQHFYFDSIKQEAYLAYPENLPRLYRGMDGGVSKS